MRDFGTKLRAKLPSRQEALTVFSVILFIVFSWALYRTFWWVPSWLEYLSIWGILIIIAYVVAFALVESLVILALLTLLSLLLPRKIFKDQFVVQGSVLSLLLGLGAFLIQRNVGVIYRLKLEQTLLYPLLILGAVILLMIITSFLFKRIQRALTLYSGDRRADDHFRLPVRPHGTDRLAGSCHYRNLW